MFSVVLVSHVSFLTQNSILANIANPSAAASELAPASAYADVAACVAASPPTSSTASEI